MDSFVGQWQEWISLLIVGAAVFFVIRSKQAAFRTDHVCSSCALMNSKEIRNKY